LSAHSGALGADFQGYRNHAYRVANFCLALTSIATETAAFRRADLVDLSNGLVSFVLPRRFPKEVFAHWPDARFRPSNIAPRWL